MVSEMNEYPAMFADRDTHISIVEEERGPVRDHCGIVSAFSQEEIPFFLTGLSGLVEEQTRGYDGAGVVCLEKNGTSHAYRGHGRIAKAFDQHAISAFRQIHAKTWAFQTRYKTDGPLIPGNLQPVVRIHKQSGQMFALVHNGQFSLTPGRSGGEDSDTVIGADELAESPEQTLDESINVFQRKKKGAWSVSIITRDAMYLLRDPRGTRPLSYGALRQPGREHSVWIAASETVALEAMGVDTFREVLPGSVVKIDAHGIQELAYPGPADEIAVCSFENVYIAEGKTRMHIVRGSPDEINAAVTTNEFRRRTGYILAREAPLTAGDVDFVIGIPGTGIIGGRAFASACKLPYIQAITDRNPLDGRTFMMPNIEKIYQKVLENFEFYASVLYGAKVGIVDDSIVRSNVMRGLNYLLRTQYGVSVVHARVLCPPIDKPCYLGINTREERELAAHEYQGDVDLIRKSIGLDSLAYLSGKGLVEAHEGSERICRGCMVGYSPPIDRYGNIVYKNGRE